MVACVGLLNASLMFMAVWSGRTVLISVVFEIGAGVCAIAADGSPTNGRPITAAVTTDDLLLFFFMSWASQEGWIVTWFRGNSASRNGRNNLSLHPSLRQDLAAC